MKKDAREEYRISYLLKRLVRSWKIFVALLLSIALASTFFSGVNVGADTIARQTLDRMLNNVAVDIQTSLWQPLSASNITEITERIANLNITEIAHVEATSWLSGVARLPRSNTTVWVMLRGIQNNSSLMEKSGSSSLGVNETYVLIDSDSLKESLELNDVLQINITWTPYFVRDTSTAEFPYFEPPMVKSLVLNLTVAGFIDLDDQTRQIIGGYNVLIVDWNKTLARIIDVSYEDDQTLNTDILIFLDRGLAIKLWDIDGSIARIDAIASQISQVISLFTGRWVYVYAPLRNILQNYGAMSQGMRLVFIIVSLPVFFIAWYMGTTLSDVSYNLRRREIGLLLTKGFSRRQLLRMFLGEALIIGLVGGMIGIGLSLILTPFFIQGGVSFAFAPTIGLDTMIITIIFSAGLTLLSVFQPARRASRMDIVDALQEYRYVEELKPYKSKWPWIAFILGSYKIIMWLLGINLFTVMVGRPLPITNVLIMILIKVWSFFDVFVLNYIGPILFFWGFTKIFIRGSLKFQEVIAKIVKFAGDLNVLSTKNVRRNPARTAALAFLIAMITGYSFQIVGSYASEQEYRIRQVKFTVGADISVQISGLQNLSYTVEKIRNVTGVSSVTVEYRFSQSADSEFMSFIAVNPEEWLNIAYYESDLFTGRDMASAFQAMKNDNNTIVLERRVAERLKLILDSEISVKLSSEKVFRLKVIGFFGPEPSQTQVYGGYYQTYWSYVPEGLYQSIKNEVYADGNILVKLESNADGRAVAEEIRKLRLSNVSAVYSVTEILEQMQSSFFLVPGMPALSLPVGSVEIQRLGVAFAVLAASVGTGLVTFVSLKERSREIGVMSVRGLSFKQVVGVLSTENLSVVGFAVLLGTVVGLIIVQGNISALNSIQTVMPGITPYASSPIIRRMVFPAESLLILTSCLVLIFASSMVPVIIMAKRYVSELERIVRGV